MSKITEALRMLNFIFIFLVFGLISCTNDPACKNENNINGDIIAELKLGKCYNLMQKDTIVINDSTSFKNLESLIDADYYQLFKNTCDTLPDSLDFSIYTLIGYYASGFGCNVNFHKDFQMDESAKKCYYTIQIEECGECSTEEFSMNWIIVPKVEDDYEIIYTSELM